MNVLKKSLALGCLLATMLPSYAQKADIIYAGTNSQRESKGLYVLNVDRKSGNITQLQAVSDGQSPNFLAINDAGTVLYVSYSRGNPDDGKGRIIAYRIEKGTGKLTKLNEQSTEGTGPAHVSLDPKGRFAYVSNYGSGSVTIHPINKNGSVAAASDVEQHSGRSIVEGRQEAPHAHSAIPSADGKFLYVSDLGIDKIMIYEVTADGKLLPAPTPFAANTPGAGPRHFAIHPNGRFAYSAEELTSTIASFSVDNSTGALSPIERVSMIPADFKERNTAADIHFSPDGKFLYASNRGHDSLVIFAIDPSTGKMTLVGHQSTGGKHPRNFMIDKKGEYVLTANRDTDNVVYLKRDKATGKLEAIGKEIKVPSVIALIQR